MTNKFNSRAAAAQLSRQIIDQGQSLDAVLNQYLERHDLSAQDRGFIQEMVYGLCRWYGELDHIAAQLLRSPIRKKDRVIHFVLLVGIYQLRHLETAQHAAVAETVNACQSLNKGWAKKLINGCLRSYLRKIVNNGLILERSADLLSHPDWINASIKQAWPTWADAILRANNQRPPMCLRVNAIQSSRQAYLEQLNQAGLTAVIDPHSVDGIILEQAVSVNALPGFFDGAVSVQDTAAQLSCDILQVASTHRVLDACAAPGGKAAHILERTADKASLVALDVSAKRCEQLTETLQRLKLSAQVYVADATQIDTETLPEESFDRILIDAPCSGLGVIRRHPDIKHHRQPSDIERLNVTQQKLLYHLWRCLAPGGRLLYMTCSILPSENEDQISRFVASQNDAMLETINHPNAMSLRNGVQTLPGVHDMDGFYYSLISKTI